jgi:hypothetical protein
MSVVYALLDTSKRGKFITPYVSFLYKPYYIGKGTEKRPLDHLYEAEYAKGKNSYKTNKILSLIKNGQDFSYVYFHCDSEREAYDKEEELINLFGRYFDGGILCNITLGGEINVKAGYIHCLDNSTGYNVYVSVDDKRIGKTLSPLCRRGHVPCVDENGDVYFSTQNEYKIGMHTHIHTGRKRTDETRSKISKGKLAYTFTDEHIENIIIANQINDKLNQLGVKRKDSTKEAISKSRTGEKSKVAKTWKFVDPNGNEYIFKGGFSKFCSMMNLSPQRMRTNKGKIISKATNKGHLNESVLNTEGWWCDHTEDEPNLCFFFIKKSVESRMKCL